MDVERHQTAAEVTHLKACINDLIGVVALPAIWSGGGPAEIVRTVLDVLLGMLDLDLVYVRLTDRVGEAPIEMVRVAQSRQLTARPHEIGAVLNHWLGDDPQQWPPLVRHPLGDGDMSLVPVRLGLRGDIGVIVAGSQRADFPGQTEHLLLRVAANQAAIGLQEARLLREQQRVATELEQRVAQRTTELAAANTALTKEIAERRLAEERLRQEERELQRSEALLAEAQRLSATGSFTWRVVTDEITWSAQTYRIFQIDRATPVTFGLIDTRLHPDDVPAFTEQLARARNDGRDVDFDCRLLLPDRSVRYLHVVAHSSRDESGHLEYTGAVQDVTEQRCSEEALSKVQSELAHVARVTSLGALTASIAHEVNQPLSGIVTNASTCLRMLAADPPNVDGARETARRTIRDGHRASEVITRLRALFRKQDATTAAVDLNEATGEVMALARSELQRHRVLLRADLADDLPPVTGDRVQLQQVVLNLLLNAADAMRGVDDRPRQVVIRTARDDGDRVRLSVQDAGVGFDPHDANRLFDAFYTTKSGGMGIGLSVSRSIIERHQGRLWAALNDGPGATFAFSLPRSPEGVTGAPSLGAMRMPAVTEAAPVRRNA